MKDNVSNRKRLSFGQKLKIARLALAENGPLWCLLLGSYYLASTVAERAYSAMDRRRRTRNIPGLNSAALNKEIWEAWDWSADGDEWTASEDSKQSFIRCVLEVEVPRDAAILEIGPGGGRWTGSLLERARSYIGVDISSTCVDHCRKRFAQAANAQFLVGSGRDLADVASGTISAIWSFDVFVHINRAEVAGYAAEFRRVLRPGGVGVIHHGAVGGTQGGWRSNLTRADLTALLAQNGLNIEKQLDQWSEGDRSYPLSYGDLVTVFSVPTSPARPVT